MGSFDEDFKWQEKFAPHLSEIAMQAFRVTVAPKVEDWKRNTDFVLSNVLAAGSKEYRVSARVRRHEYVRRYRDQFTVRVDRPSGYETEMPKIRAGWGDLMIYGFESYPESDRLGPWFMGNIAMLRRYIAEGGWFDVRANKDGSSRLGAFHLGDMPLGFVIASEGLDALDDSRVWERCRRCYWWRDTGGSVMPTDDFKNPASGQGRLCLACGFWWRAGWVMNLYHPVSRKGDAA